MEYKRFTWSAKSHDDMKTIGEEHSQHAVYDVSGCGCLAHPLVHSSVHSIAENIYVVKEQQTFKSRKTINPKRSHPTCQIIANLIIAILFCCCCCLKGILKSIFVLCEWNLKSRWKRFCARQEHFGTFQLNMFKIVRREVIGVLERSEEIFIGNYKCIRISD